MAQVYYDVFMVCQRCQRIVLKNFPAIDVTCPEQGLVAPVMLCGHFTNCGHFITWQVCLMTRNKVYCGKWPSWKACLLSLHVFCHCVAQLHLRGLLMIDD